MRKPRRLRGSAVVRDLVSETGIHPAKLIMPHFVVEGKGVRQGIGSMPGIDRVSVDNLVKDAESDLKFGIKPVLLFGIPETKDELGTGAYAEDGIVQRAVRELKKELPEVFVISDVCLCEYTSHGHCGVVEDGCVLNEPTLDLLVKTALSQVEAGADMVAPSDMMDCRVRAIREGLNDRGFNDTPIMSYAAKYSSAFYGPFRDAADSAPQFGDRQTYQMDMRNAQEAVTEVLLDIEEGADIVMVKPALAYLDVITRVREVIDLPLCAYNVSGEFSMVKLMAEKGYGSEERLVREIMTGIFRAGADMIITYHARDILKNRWF